MASRSTVLYALWRSSCSYRLRIALNLKEIEYDIVPVDTSKDEQKAPEYLVKNPRGLVPTLVVGDTIITESLAIMEYLEEKYPNTHTMLPGGPEKRAKTRALALMVIANTQPLQNLSVLKAVCDDPSKQKMWAQRWIEASFDAIEKELDKSSGKYSVGDDITLADVCLVPQVSKANSFAVDLSRYPNIQRVNDALLQVPAFQKAHPDNQPDAEKGLS